MVNARRYLAEQLTPLLPRGWKLVPYGVSLDHVAEPVVMIQQVSVTPTEQAPLAYHTITLAVVIVSPITLEESAEDAIDANVNELLFALDELESLSWSNATKETYAETNLSYRVDVDINIQKG